MTKRLLILDGSLYPAFYEPAAVWQGLAGDVPADAVHLPTGGRVPDLDAYTHVIVTGSEASIMQPQPWFEVEAAAIRDALDRGLPLLGSCFGHQMLVRTLSGPEHVARSETPELGWIEVEPTAADELLDGLSVPLHVWASHFDEIRDPPAPWRVLARSRLCPVQVIRHGDRPVWGLQAHPEITPADAHRLVGGFLELLPEQDEALQRYESLFRAVLVEEPRDDAVAAEIVQRFLRA